MTIYNLDKLLQTLQKSTQPLKHPKVLISETCHENIYNLTLLHQFNINSFVVVGDAGFISEILIKINCVTLLTFTFYRQQGRVSLIKQSFIIYKLFILYGVSQFSQSSPEEFCLKLCTSYTYTPYTPLPQTPPPLLHKHS